MNRKRQYRVCPVWAMRELIRNTTVDRTATPEEQWYISAGKLKKGLKYDGFLKGVRLMLQEIEVSTKDEDENNLYDTHRLRRGGAQGLAMA